MYELCLKRIFCPVFLLLQIPKLLVHRMFPNARYSLWIDGKLELVVDPYQLLERYIWLFVNLASLLRGSVLVILH